MFKCFSVFFYQFNTKCMVNKFFYSYLMADLSKFKCPFDASKFDKIVTRFPPEPSGFLHIGHIKASVINFYYAKMNKGEMILRFDDTNPSKENTNFVENIIADLKTLGISWNLISHTSDYFAKITEYMTSLIKQGIAYADSTPKDQMKQDRMKGIESIFRKATIEENLKNWEEMQKGTPEGQNGVLGLKLICIMLINA